VPLRQSIAPYTSSRYVEAFFTVDCSPLKISVQRGIVCVTHMLLRTDGFRGPTDLPYNEYWRLTRVVKRPEYEAYLTPVEPPGGVYGPLFLLHAGLLLTV
jgi:hypothetical protein